MDELRFTLLSDGPGDKALMPILTWLLRHHLPTLPVQATWADLRRLPRAPRHLDERIQTAIDLYPCDILFAHRDAEGDLSDNRVSEIRTAVTQARLKKTIPPVVRIVPIRMTETWLLFDENAIRCAAGNPNGGVSLTLPKIRDLESVPDPKRCLNELLLTATELGTHRRSRFDVSAAVQRVADYIGDFSPLRQLSAFCTLEQELVQTLATQFQDII